MPEIFRIRKEKMFFKLKSQVDYGIIARYLIASDNFQMK